MQFTAQNGLDRITALYQLIVDVIMVKSSNQREQYKFVKGFLEEVNNDEIHPLIIEKGFQAISGKTYSVPEIKYLLSFTNPSDAIYFRSSSSSFVNYDNEKNTYNWKKPYSYKPLNKVLSLLYLLLYIVFAFTALLPILFKGTEILSTMPIALYSVSLGIVSITFLVNHENYKHAIKLMKIQKRA